MDSSASPNQDNFNKEKNAEKEDIEEELSDLTSQGKRKANEATSQPKKKPIPARSDCWKHFTRKADNRDSATCHHCKRDFSCNSKSGTSNLLKHMKIYKELLAWEEGKAKRQPVINEEGGLKDARISETIFREASNEMLVLGELPFSFIESVAWRHFCKKVNLYKPLSRRIVTRDIVDMYVQRKASLKEWFLANKQRVSLTTDIWTCQTNGASYMVITAHYIDALWQLKKLIIGFKYITNHKGQTIATVLLDCLAEWGIEKVFCVTVDNASANSTALLKFLHYFALISPDSLVLDGEFLHVRCSAHIINLIVRDGLAEIDENVSAIRNAISYVRSSTNRQKSFELRVDSLKMTRGSLPLDIKTRWNSTYLMLTNAMKFEAAFERMYAEDKLYNDYFLEDDNGKKRVGPPRETDWTAISRLAKFLKIFYSSTLVVSASSSLNSYKCYGEIVNIATNLIELSYSLDSDLKTKAREMLAKFEKYWDDIKNMNKMLIVASVFDPRKKMQFAKLCFEELYGKDTVESKKMYKSVSDVLCGLFKEYTERFGKSTSSQSQRSQQFQSSQSSPSSQQSNEKEELVDDGFGLKRIELRYNELLNELGVEDSGNELQIYLKESVVKVDLMVGIEFDVLSWWRLNSHTYPVLSEIARDVLAMQVSSVASESAFSTSGRIICPYRNSLNHYLVEVLMCTEQWMKQDIRYESRVLTNAQILAEVEYEDNLEKEFEFLNVQRE